MTDMRSKTINKIMIVLIVLGFAIVAGAFLHAAHLTEYEGTLEENLSFTLPAGYAEPAHQGNNENDKTYVREKADTRETINIYYAGLESDDGILTDETIHLGDDTEIGIDRYDWGHDNTNALLFTINHGDESYLVEYQCRIGDQRYYDSCSKEQEEEMMSFIGTFDFHRPDGSDMTALQRLYRNFGTAGCIVLALTVLFFVGVPVAMGIAGLTGSREEGKGSTSDVAVSSKDLHADMNRERTAKGEESLPSINTVQGMSTNNLARRDHSWSSVPDFFVKLFRKK